MGSPFQAADAGIIAALGSTVTYSRPVSAQLAAVAAFQVKGVVNTSGEYASPSGTLFGEVFLQTATIPLGPQKGDLLVISNPAPGRQSGTYVVQSVFLDPEVGSAYLKIRWTGN